VPAPVSSCLFPLEDSPARAVLFLSRRAFKVFSHAGFFFFFFFFFFVGGFFFFVVFFFVFSFFFFFFLVFFFFVFFFLILDLSSAIRNSSA